MASAKDLDMMQTYLFGKRDTLDLLISTVRGPGSRAFKVRLTAMRDRAAQELMRATRDLLDARRAEAASEVKAQGVAGS